MGVPPIRADFCPDSLPVEALGPWRSRLDRLLAELPAWAQFDAMRVPAERLGQIDPGPMLVLGFGGSALGARATLRMAAAAKIETQEIRVLDSLDAELVADAFDWASARNAGLLIISKSGKTIEVSTLLRAALGRGLRPRALVSDPQPNPMDALLGPGAGHQRYELPAAVGGRYSIFTAVGQVPLHCAGLDPNLLISGAKRHLEHLVAEPETLLRTLAFRHANPTGARVIWTYADALLPFAAWIQQLECESLGRDRHEHGRVGELVTVLRGPADQHSVAQLLIDGPRDKRVVLLDFESEPAAADLAEISRLRAIERDATFAAVGEALPTTRVLVADRAIETLGALMLEGMVSTVLLAESMGIDPYGQPAVQHIKTRIAAHLE